MAVAFGTRPTGITFVGRPVVAPDGSRYAYSYIKHISDLYVVEGLLAP